MRPHDPIRLPAAPVLDLGEGWAAVAKRSKVIGTDRVEVTFRFTLSREVMEKLTTQAIREARTVEAIVAEIIEESQG